MGEARAVTAPGPAASLRLPTPPCALHPADGPCGACTARRLAFCSRLRPDELATLRRHVVPLHLAAHTVLVHEGDGVERLYTVTRGMLRRVRHLADGRRQITAFLVPGDLVDLEVTGVHHGTVEAVVPSDVCSIGSGTLASLAARLPQLKDGLFGIACAALDRARESQLSLGRRTPLEKLAAFVLDMGALQAAAGLPAEPVRLPMTRTDIADFLGLTIETVSRTLSRLQRLRIIRLATTHTVELVDRRALAELADRL